MGEQHYNEVAWRGMEYIDLAQDVDSWLNILS
jgi:hypothetical protein